MSIDNLFRLLRACYPSGMAGWRVIGKLIGSATLLALLAGFMWYFHIASYTFLAWALAGSLVIFLWTLPDLAGVIVTVLLSAGFALIYNLIRHEPVWGAALAFLGMGSIARLGLAAIWCGPAERDDHLATCLRASMFPLYMAIAGFSIAVTTIVHPKTYDLFLYAFDAQLGVSPSFLIGKTLARLGVLRQICYYGYESLPMAMAIAFAMDGKKRRDGSGIMAAFTVAATGGFVLYNLYPATGPIHVFGNRFHSLLQHPCSLRSDLRRGSQLRATRCRPFTSPWRF